MKIYPPKEGLSAEELKRGWWLLYVDVQCTNPECGKVYSLANAGGLGAPCKKCGAPCL
jgi:hypothetical protein